MVPRLVAMAARSRFLLLAAGLLAGSLRADAIALKRPSLSRIQSEMEQQQRRNAVRKGVRNTIYVTGGLTLASLLFRDYLVHVLPEHTVPKEPVPLGFGERIGAAAGYLKRLITPAPPPVSEETLTKQLLSDAQLRTHLADFIKEAVSEQGFSGQVKVMLKSGLKFSLVIALISWIEQRPLTLLRTYLDRLWSIWHSNVTVTIMHLSDVASNLEIMRTFVEALGQKQLNLRDRQFYVAQMVSSHAGFVRSVERLCGLMSIDVADQATLAWMHDFDNGFWETFGRFSSLLEHDLAPAETGDEGGLPAAIQEAMANGLAIVSTRHGGIPEAVREGETGLLANEGDVGAMAEAFLEIRSKTVAFGQAGFRRAAENYSWDHEKSRLRQWLELDLR